MNWIKQTLNRIFPAQKRGDYSRIKIAHIKVASEDGLELFVDHKGEIVIEDMYLADAIHIRPEDWKAFVEAVNRIDKLLMLK